ncbi:MAG TPA: hypothetical protein K8V56_01295 [Sporosarcina psychrophila]|uniref:Antitoxin SocA-like Panacea domain-containing protein n=1 Tax=Sporosarcina psychrophila TaxID=1476 RepID=A0A921FX31_SPOPS|nr:hypothetical protein [Sporosarcina psychrophila]
MNSSEDRLTKAAWFKSHTETFSASPLKLQKFLFFYEMFAKVEQEEYDLSYLRAYPNGPVFSNTYGDLRYNQTEFFAALDSVKDFSIIREKIARAALMLVNTFTDTEISDLTHRLDLWKSKEELIQKGQRCITIFESDITDKDVDTISSLYDEYAYLSNQGFKVFSMLEKIFIISPEDFNELTEQHHEIIELLSQDRNLDNPVYLELDDGVLLID